MTFQPLAQVWKTVRSFGTVADWSAPIGMERITSILLVHSHWHVNSSCHCFDWTLQHMCVYGIQGSLSSRAGSLSLQLDVCSSMTVDKMHGLVQPGSMEGQLGALRRVCFGELGFVEQLDALDDEKKLL